MKTRIVVSALALALLSSVALAEGCRDRPDIRASSCAEGLVWDMAKGECVLQPTS